MFICACRRPVTSLYFWQNIRTSTLCPSPFLVTSKWKRKQSSYHLSRSVSLAHLYSLTISLNFWHSFCPAWHTGTCLKDMVSLFLILLCYLVFILGSVHSCLGCLEVTAVTSCGSRLLSCYLTDNVNLEQIRLGPLTPFLTHCCLFPIPFPLPSLICF